MSHTHHLREIPAASRDLEDLWIDWLAERVSYGRDYDEWWYEQRAIFDGLYGASEEWITCDCEDMDEVPF